MNGLSTRHMSAAFLHRSYSWPAHLSARIVSPLAFCRAPSPPPPCCSMRMRFSMLIYRKEKGRIGMMIGMLV